MNFREIAKLDLNYYEINREERNYAAILFTASCKTSNSLIFLNRCRFEINTLGPDYGIYFEYSFLRDLCFQLYNNEIKKDIINNLLKIKEIDLMLNKPIVGINTIFGTSGKPSIKLGDNKIFR